MARSDTFSLESILEAVAGRVAEKLRAEVVPGLSGGGIRPRLLTVKQAADYLGRSETGVQHLVAEGAVPVVRSDRRVFLDREDLDRWIEGNKV